MNKKNKIYIIFVIAVLIIPILSYQVLRYIKSNSDLPYYDFNYQQVNQQDAKKVAYFDFINQDNQQVNGKDFIENKVWVACYFFTTCPSICPIMISGMEQIHKEYGNDSNLRLVSFTVDPDTDVPEVLKQYAENRDINTKQWAFVTGEKIDLYRYARKELTLVATDGDGGPQDFIHSDRLVLIDQNNHIRGYYDGTEKSEVSQLKKDIQKLLD